MITETLKLLAGGVSVKENLIKLKDEIRADKSEGAGSNAALSYLCSSGLSMLEGFLQDADPKIRKNAALILGDIGADCAAQALIEAYSREETMYVRNAYLTALSRLDYGSFAEILKGFRERLEAVELTPENRKHILEERRLLIGMTENLEPHVFTGYDITNELILITNRDYKQLTIQDLSGLPHKEFNAGVMVRTDRLREVLNCRLYDELLFVPEGLKACDGSAADIGRTLVCGGLFEFMDKRHEGGAPFCFRVELKSRQPEKDVKFVKQLASTIEEESNFRLLNSKNSYEFELRLVERSTGGYSVMVKLMTLKDMRFSYRGETIASCIRPYNAALMMALAKPYFREGAAVLDPFCGVATLLVERAKCGKTDVMYGIDIYGEAIEKAKKNTAGLTDGTKLYFINRDFFEFTHGHKFDEIITDMPFPTSKNHEREINELYRKFFDKAPSLLNEDGMIIMYSRNGGLVRRFAKGSGGLGIIKEYEISKREGAYVFIIKSCLS